MFTSCSWLPVSGIAFLCLAVLSAWGGGKRIERVRDGLNRRLEPYTGVRYDRLAKDPRWRLVQRMKRWLAAVTFAFLGAATLYVWAAACPQ